MLSLIKESDEEENEPMRKGESWWSHRPRSGSRESKEQKFLGEGERIRIRKWEWVQGRLPRPPDPEMGKGCCPDSRFWLK